MKNHVIALAFILGLSALALGGCGEFDKSVTGLTGSAQRCVDGVMYINFTTGATPKYQKSEEPKLVLC